MAEIRPRIAPEIPRLRRYARALTRDVTSADDLVQECLTRAVSKSHLWEEGTELRAWLFTIMHNQYVNQVRRSVREGTAVALSDTNAVLTCGHSQEKRLELRDLERALAKLPEEQRSALLLVGMEGMKYEEAATVLGVAVGTIRSRAVARPRGAAPADGHGARGPRHRAGGCRLRPTSRSPSAALGSAACQTSAAGNLPDDSHDEPETAQVFRMLLRAKEPGEHTPFVAE
jgi:RNA polymerase sigma-70 factor, ECF subfamily